MQKRDFLLMLKRLQLIDPVHLTASRVISILAESDKNIRLPNSQKSSAIRLDIEVNLFFFPDDFRSFYFVIYRCVSWNFSRPSLDVP